MLVVLRPSLDLFDNMYELTDSLTFKLRAIAPNMWPVFELTYKLFKSDAVDFLDGELWPQCLTRNPTHVAI